MDFERGSEWRRWDLHLHTASSYDYKGEDNDALLIEKLKENNIAAVAITDHFVIDKERIKNLRSLSPEIVFFPGVELRTDKGDTNVHVILIFSDKINIDELVEDFNVFKRSAQNHDDNEKIYWDYSKIIKFAEAHDALISIHAGRKSNGVDDRISNSLPHNQAVKEEYASTVSIFEMGQLKDLDDYRKHVFSDIGVKPMIICSDNHDARNYNPTNKLWIKADVTFNGLKQIIYEPEERVRISDSIPDYKPNYYTIDSVVFKDDSFQTEPIKFSKNLTCVIGGKSTGKSILLHNLARAIDKEQVEQKENISKTSTKDVDEIAVFWADGKNDDERKIIYIPQTYLNRLSDEKESKTEIDSIIEDVVLIDEKIKTENMKMFDYIKSYKKEVQQSIIELISNHNEIISTLNSKKELGNQKGIENEIASLNAQKEELSKDLNLSEEKLKSYEDAVGKIKDIKRKISDFESEIENIKKINSVVVKTSLDESFSDYTLELLKKSIDDTVETANLFWNNEKMVIIDKLNNVICELRSDLKEYQNCESLLKDKVNENKAVKDLTEKIQQEKEKLEKFNALNKREAEEKKKENSLITELCASIYNFKKIQKDYADVVNNNFDITSNDLVFEVLVPFKRDLFIGKLSSVFNNRTKSYDTIVSPSDFTEEKYTELSWLRKIVESILNGELPLKGGYNAETALREIFDNWYGIKYSIKMDNDSIDVMSPGKKALVLLKLLIDLTQSQCPILIDQPEDDLDNRSIFEDLIPFIKKKKKDRQIIIATHNANVVLGADAEEVIVANQQGNNVPNKKYRFEYRTGSIENDQPVYNADGSMDLGILNSQGIQQHICDILEGGERAFELRKNKYHI